MGWEPIIDSPESAEQVDIVEEKIGEKLAIL